MRPLPPNPQPHPTRQHANPTPHQVMLPKGSCVAKGAQLDGDKVAQGKWDSWCDVNCVASKWGGLGGKGGCRDGSETGSVGCVCKQGLTPVSVKTGRPLGAAAQGGNTEHLGAQGGSTEHQAVPELVKANAPQPQAQRATSPYISPISPLDLPYTFPRSPLHLP